MIFDLKKIVKVLMPLLSKELGKRATYKDVASALDIPYNRFRQNIHKNSIPYKEILVFCFRRKISINYLFFNQLPESLIEDTNNIITLKYNKDMLGSLGDGLKNYEFEAGEIAIDKYLLDFIQGDYKNTELIQGCGDSMEPLIADNSLIFIDTSKTNILNNRIYAVLINEELYIKHITKDKDKIVLKSFNKIYKEITSKEYTVIGKVVGVLSRF